MTLESPLWEQALPYSARLDRSLIAALLAEGVLGAGDLAVTQRGAGANLSVDVAAGSAAIVGDDQANQGTYLVKNTAVVNLVIGAPPGANSRIDLIVAQVRDANVTGVNNDWTLSVIAGVAAGAPVAPAVPNTAIALAQVLVATGTAAITNAMITDRRSLARRSGEAPAGELTMSAAAAIPTGWLECNGAAVSRTLYAELYAALGGGASPWGQGNGTTTFNVPDLRDRLPIGANAVALGAAAARQHSHVKSGGVSGTGGVSTGGQSADHTHFTTTGTESADHAHGTGTAAIGYHDHDYNATSPTNFVATTAGSNYGADHNHGNTGGRTAAHTHSGTSGGVSAGHSHDFNHGHGDTIAYAAATHETVVGVRYLVKV